MAEIEITLSDRQMNLSPPRSPRTSLLETEGGAVSEGTAGGAVVFACFDCGVTLSDTNRTNKDSVLDGNEAKHPICDDCSEERWMWIRWSNEKGDI